MVFCCRLTFALTVGHVAWRFACGPLQRLAMQPADLKTQSSSVPSAFQGLDLTSCPAITSALCAAKAARTSLFSRSGT